MTTVMTILLIRIARGRPSARLWTLLTGKALPSGAGRRFRLRFRDPLFCDVSACRFIRL
jgi:hypothetical protein